VTNPATEDDDGDAECTVCDWVGFATELNDEPAIVPEDVEQPKGEADEPAPVRVELHAEWNGGDSTEVYEYDRAEWEAMTPAERRSMLESDAMDHMSSSGASCGYSILGDDAGSDEDQEAALPHLADQPAITGGQTARVDELDRWLDAADVAGYASVTDLLNAMRVRRDDLARQSADRDTSAELADYQEQYAEQRTELDRLRQEREALILQHGRELGQLHDQIKRLSAGRDTETAAQAMAAELLTEPEAEGPLSRQLRELTDDGLAERRATYDRDMNRAADDAADALGGQLGRAVSLLLRHVGKHATQGALDGMLALRVRKVAELVTERALAHRQFSRGGPDRRDIDKAALDAYSDRFEESRHERRDHEAAMVNAIDAVFDAVACGDPRRRVLLRPEGGMAVVAQHHFAGVRADGGELPWEGTGDSGRWSDDQVAGWLEMMPTGRVFDPSTVKEG
jgi:hypothetical protein